MEVNLTDMWRKMRKALGMPLIETPKTEIILPIKSAGVITGIDVGDGKDTSVIMVSGPKYGSSILASGRLPFDDILNQIKLNEQRLQKIQKLQTKWNISTEVLAPPEEFETIEVALRMRHAPSKQATTSLVRESALVKLMTDKIVADIDSMVINGSTTDDLTIDSITGAASAAPLMKYKTKYLVNPNFVYMGGGDILGKPERKFRYPTIAEALRMRHRKEEDYRFVPVEHKLYSKKDIKVQAMSRDTPFFSTPLFSLDKLWVK